MSRSLALRLGQNQPGSTDRPGDLGRCQTVRPETSWYQAFTAAFARMGLIQAEPIRARHRQPAAACPESSLRPWDMVGKISHLSTELAAIGLLFAPLPTLAFGTTTVSGEAPAWTVRRVEQPGVRWRPGRLTDDEPSDAAQSAPVHGQSGATSVSLGPGGVQPFLPPAAPSWTVEPQGPAAPPFTPPPNAEPPLPAPMLALRSISRGISVNGYPYPDTSIYVPNGYAQDKQALLTFGLNGTSRIRYCDTANQPWLNCSDAELMLELTPFRGDNASLGFNWTVQSLTSRNQGTRAFTDAQSFGFRAAYNITPTIGFAIGGEQVLHLDNKTDLGHNFYAVLSQALPLGPGEKPPMLIATTGVGTDFFAYGGNGTLGTINCGGGNSLTSTTYPKGTDCKVGPISSLSLALNDRFALGLEWFGYGFGAGVSLRPMREVPLTLTLYATDFLGNYPAYIGQTCPNGSCTARYYGKFSLSF
jgi:hypothetical protein